MQKQAIPKEPVASYKEVRIGKTLYRVTSVFSGEKDLVRMRGRAARPRERPALSWRGAPQAAPASCQGPFRRKTRLSRDRGSCQS